MIFFYNFHDICYVKFLITRFLPKKKKKGFLLHCNYVYNFENCYWILHIQHQFTITVCKILLNTIQNKRIK